MAKLVIKDTMSASRLWLARRMVTRLAQELPGRAISVTADSAYAGEELKKLPDGVTWTTRLRVNAALHDLPPERTGKKGRPRVKGERLPDLYSGKAKYTGMNVQIACNLKGDVAAIGPVPVHGARHDAYAFEASGLKEIRRNPLPQANTAPTSATSESTASGSCRSSASAERSSWTGSVNSTRSSARSAPPWSTAVAKVKTWRMLSREGGRYRCPIGKFESMLAAVSGLFFFARIQ